MRLLFQLILLVVSLILSTQALADEYTSSSFKVRDPDINLGGQTEGTSPSFKGKSTTGQPVTGQSTSTSYIVRSGFQYYDEVQTGTIVFSGFGSPTSLVTILDGGTVIATTTVAPDSSFLKSVALAAGLHSVSLYQEDSLGRRSNTIGFLINVNAGITQSFSNIYFAPTISVDKTTLTQGQTITMAGFAQTGSTVTVTVNSNTITRQVPANSGSGAYTIPFTGADTQELGLHTTYPKSQSGSLQSENGLVLSFTVTSACSGADFNKDGKVNLTDLSIMLFYWNTNPTGNPCVDLNKDGTVNLTDFSILLFNWTG